ncbi:hypothetical protein AAFX30_06515 [Vibrio chagasii]|uniref:hypothetical protein n=1 Tax=Vibrio chagasii TaxID=170679 RepID=UPI0038CD2F71
MIKFIDRLLAHKVTKAALWVLFFTYVYFMFLAPIISPMSDELGAWENLMATLYNWQSFNSSVIALLAALLAVFVTVRSETMKVERERKVHKKMLSEGMSALTNYLNGTVDIIKQERYVQGELSIVSLEDTLPTATQRMEKFFLVTNKEDEKLTEHMMLLVISIQINNQILVALKAQIGIVTTCLECRSELADKLNDKNLSVDELKSLEKKISENEERLKKKTADIEYLRDVVVTYYTKLSEFSLGLWTYCCSDIDTYSEEHFIKPLIDEPIRLETFTYQK